MSVKIRFSIGAKLIIIISFIVIISLGSITALVSWLVQGDLRLSAEENNFEINRRSALEAETTLTNIRSNSRILMQTITAVGSETALARETIEFFFTENPQTAALFMIIPGEEEQLLINNQFFSSREIPEELASSYFQDQQDAFGRAARGETFLLNAAPHFTRSVLVLFFPWQGGGVGGVLFSSENLNNNLGFGINQSYMINSNGDILVHSDFSLIRSGLNIGNNDYIRSILDSAVRSRQQLIETDLEFYRQDDTDNGAKTRNFIAFTKLSIAGVTVITSIEYNKVFEGIAATTRRNIYLTIAVLSISIILIWFFSKSISIPLKSLAHAARQIETGVFDVELYPKGNDEIGVLTSSFQKMCSALHIFGRFTNREIAVKAMRGEIKPGGLPKHATIFFSDIRDFTAKSENFTNVFGNDASDKIVYWLNSYFTQMIDCIEKTNGTVDKFIGDAIMAHWGTAYTEGSPEKDAISCVNAALMMRKALYNLNKARKIGDPANPLIQIGCGINSGIITAGQLGSDKRMEYTVIGDPVNLASRVESLTKLLGADILMAENTWRLVRDSFITEELPSVRVKGKEKSVRIFAVVNYADNTDGPKTLAEVRDILGIKTPDLAKLKAGDGEKKNKSGKTG
jgi:adenylate cyclase